MLTAVLVISIASLVLNVIAVWQRHVSIQVQRKNGKER